MDLVFYGRKYPIENHEYLFDVLLKDYSNINCDYLTVDSLPDKQYDIVVYSCREPDGDMHWGRSPSYTQVETFVKIAKPKIILQTMDECAAEHLEIHNLLSNYCNLLLRHCRHGSQLYTYNSRVEAIPLGYLNGFKYLKDVKEPSHRKYTWGWVGHLKNDRVEMIQQFWRIWSNIVITGANLPTNEVSEIYCNSVFVPCGRGNFTLDCWRIYEAVISGAIPIIVGSRQEIEDTFTFFGELPPFIFSDNWSNAVSYCQTIQFKPDELLVAQTEIINWWNRTMDKIQSKIKIALESEFEPLPLEAFKKLVQKPRYE